MRSIHSYSLIGHLKKCFFFFALVLGSASLFEACLSSSKLAPVHSYPAFFVFLETDIFFSLLAQPHQTFSLLWDRFFKTCNFGAQKDLFLVDERLSGEEMLRFQKHPDTSGRGLNCTYRTVHILSFSVICNSQYISLPRSSANRG